MSELASQEFSGKSVEEATADGLRAMGLRAEDATIEILNRGSRGLFGIGSEPAVVRISPRTAGAPAVIDTVINPDDGSLAPTVIEEIVVDEIEVEVDEVIASVEEDDIDDEGLAEVMDEEIIEVDEVIVEVTDGTSNTLVGDMDDEDEEVAAMASDMLGTMIGLMGFDCTVDSEWRDADEITEERHLLLSAHGPEASGLIGRRGETLENIQYLLRLMVNQRMHRWLNIIVDIEDFRAHRVEHLSRLAERIANQVVETGRAQALEPMTPNERRIVHLVLRDDTRIFTESTGEGERRKVVIFPQHS